MSQRKIALCLDEFYHVYNRGNSKQVIFKDSADYVRFQQLLFIANASTSFNFRSVKRYGVFDFEKGEPLVYIGAYCLMPNHFHLLLTPAVEDGVQLFMQKLATSYSMYFNKRYERTGGLFEGRFRSQHVDSDEYLKYLFSYIHLNPAKLIFPNWKNVGAVYTDEIKSYVSQFEYSSLFDYLRLSTREESGILYKDKFPEYFTSPESWIAELETWLRYDENPIDLGPA